MTSDWEVGESSPGLLINPFHRQAKALPHPLSVAGALINKYRRHIAEGDSVID